MVQTVMLACVHTGLVDSPELYSSITTINVLHLYHMDKLLHSYRKNDDFIEKLESPDIESKVKEQLMPSHILRGAFKSTVFSTCLFFHTRLEATAIPVLSLWRH